MFQIENVVQRPMKVIGDKRYLLKQAIEGVAYNSPGAAASTWKVCSQFGHVTVS